VDLFDVLVPELAPFRHPNSAHAWWLYFDAREERREAMSRQHATECADASTTLTWADGAGGTPDAGGASAGASAAALAPLFVVSPPPGVDAQGRVLDQDSGDDLPTNAGRPDESASGAPAAEPAATFSPGRHTLAETSTSY
jgi:hypothetical protein